MQLDPDFREFVASFNEHDVRYLVVGGYALAAHGLPRATGDLDAWGNDDSRSTSMVSTSTSLVAMTSYETRSQLIVRRIVPTSIA